MSDQGSTQVSTQVSTPSSPKRDEPIGALVKSLSDQMSLLVRDELRLAQLELAAKGKKAGLGAGMFGGAGLFAFFGLAALITTAILALAGPLSPWLAALIVAAALFVVAGIAALAGKREVTQATPPVPEEAVAGVKQDVQTLRSGSSA
jgi:uncharacterized membrane protein YqjE